MSTFWTEWLAMGGYAAFVWPGYALSLIALAWIIAQPVARYRRLIKAARRQAQRDKS